MYALDQETDEEVWSCVITEYNGGVQGNSISGSSPAIYKDSIIFGDVLNPAQGDCAPPGRRAACVCTNCTSFPQGLSLRDRRCESEKRQPRDFQGVPPSCGGQSRCRIVCGTHVARSEGIAGKDGSGFFEK